MVTDVGMQNNMYASLLLGCYEVNQVFTLLGRKIVASVTEYSILSFKCIVELFQFTFNTLDCQVSNHAGAILRSNSGFITSKFDPEDQSTLKYCISLIQSLVITSLSERTPLIKEESELCKTIALLSSCFMFNSNESQSKGHREQLITWLRILCKERAIDNVSLTKIIVNMLVKLEREISDFDMVPEFGHDILSALGSCDTGDIDLKLDESQTPIFAIVNLRASNINCVILLEFIEQTCDEIEWPLIRMRLVISKKGYNDEEELIDLGEFENSICKKLVILINTLIYLEQKIAEAGDISNNPSTLLKRLVYV
ncbi:7307_t:CDS:2 [Entrophospora sp. SA101]|nr:7307_t:CDS:2 [Entrophospora sp. SA101]